MKIHCVMGDAHVEAVLAMATSEVHDRGARVLLDAAHFDESKGWTQVSVCLTPGDARRLAEELLELAGPAEAAR